MEHARKATRNTYHSIGWTARDPEAELFRDSVLPGGAVVRVLDNGAHKAALESAGKALHELARRSGQRDERGSRMTQEHAEQTDLPKPPFDPVFPRLVNEAEGTQKKLVGFLAYGLYQEAKRDWISDFFARENRYPDAEELRTYDQSWTASRLEALHNAGAQLITAYTDSVVIQAERQILRSALRGRFWRAVWRSLAGALLYTCIIAGLALGLSKVGVDLVGIAKEVIKVP